MPRKITGIVAIFILAGIAGWAQSQLKPSARRPIRRLEYRLSDRQRFSGSGLQLVAVSQDGSKLAFATLNGLYLCSGEPLTAAFIPGTQGTTAQPFFSPDGKWIGYWSLSDGLLKKVASEGGIPISLRGLGFILGAHWHADNSIVFGQATSGILQIPAHKGPINTLVSAGTEGSVFPQILPDGRSILYTAIVSNRSHIAVRTLKTSEDRKLLLEGSAGWYLPSGHILYRSSGNNVLAVPFDLNKLEISGEPIPLFPGILGEDRAAQYAVSETGALAYIPDYTGKPGQQELVWVTREGKETSISAPQDAYASPRISPDGTRVALTVKAGQKKDICVWDLTHATMTRLSSEDTDSSDPLWSKDSQRIVYRTSNRESGFDIYSRFADGSSDAQKLTSIPNRNYLIYWSKEGKELTLKAFQGLEGEGQPQISPDGRWLAYESDESGQSEVYVRPFPDVHQGKWLVSAQGGTSPLWSPDGRELFYRDAESVIAIPIEAGKVFKTGSPSALFWRPETAVGADKSAIPMWDIHPDGKRFLMLQRVQPIRKVVLLMNWLDELKRK